jgi:hypothetical protein
MSTCRSSDTESDVTVGDIGAGGFLFFFSRHATQPKTTFFGMEVVPLRKLHWLVILNLTLYLILNLIFNLNLFHLVIF